MSVDLLTLRNLAQKVLRDNDRGGYTIPNADVYPFQWNWDALFSALGWLTFDEPRAWLEMEKLFEGQWENGMVPSIVFHHKSSEYFPGPDIWQVKSKAGLETTGITQMPIAVAGTVLIYKLAKDRSLAKEKFTLLYPKLYKYLAWCYMHRGYRDTGLCQIYHGWESMDNSPLWDKALEQVKPTASQFERKDKNCIPAEQRPEQWDYERYISIVEKLRSVSYDSCKYNQISEMTIVDAAFNGVLLGGTQALLSVVGEFGTSLQETALKEWQMAHSNSFSMLWDDALGIYVDYDVRAERYIKEPVSGGFIPLFAGLAGGDESAYRKKLQRWIAQGLPSVDIESSKFEAMRYWRGPSWTIMNFLIYCGALLVGWEQEADAIKERSLLQIRTGGFYENFNPIDNSGGGGTHFSWTAAAYLYWLDEFPRSFDFKKLFF